MPGSLKRPLHKLTREDLEPIWNRREIPLDRIAAALGVTRQGLTYKAKSLGLQPRSKNYEPQKKGLSDEKFIQLLEDGVLLKDIAAAYGYERPSNLTTRRRNMGLPPRTRSRGKGGHAGWGTGGLHQLEERLAEAMSREVAK